MSEFGHGVCPLSRSLARVAVCVLLSVAAGLAQEPEGWRHVTPSSGGLPKGEVRAVLAATSGAVWFAVRGAGLARLDGTTWHYVTTEDGLVSNGIADLREVGGAIWAAGQGGYSVLGAEHWRAFSDVGGREARVVFSVTPARDGTVWLAANGFAARLDTTGFSHVAAADGLPHDVVHQVWVDRDGARWFACRRGLARLAETPGAELEVFHPEINFRSIVEDDDGRLWFGTGGDGVFSYAPEGGWARHLEGAVLPAVVDAAGRVWALTEGSGVHVYDGARWRTVTTDDGLLSNVVYDIERGDLDGRSLWFATDRGASLYQLSPSLSLPGGNR